MAKSPFQTVDEYIASYSGDVRERLERMRAIIRSSAPQAEERLSWGAPCYYLNGFLVQFAAAKKHIGFYSSPEAIGRFAEELAEYETNQKNTVRLPLNKPLPEALVVAMTRFQASGIAQNKSVTKLSLRPETKWNIVME